MRIISGFLKGKRIKYTKNIITRPLRDSVKENIFNILRHSNSIKIKIEKANVLDLYSGVGSFGIECISRGAKKVTFVEQNKNAASILENNLTDLSILKKNIHDDVYVHSGFYNQLHTNGVYEELIKIINEAKHIIEKYIQNGRVIIWC